MVFSILEDGVPIQELGIRYTLMVDKYANIAKLIKLNLSLDKNRLIDVKVDF